MELCRKLEDGKAESVMPIVPPDTVLKKFEPGVSSRKIGCTGAPSMVKLAELGAAAVGIRTGRTLGIYEVFPGTVKVVRTYRGTSWR